jgi:pimeloyl-ACP methyl ester carboxylesterase
VQLLSTPQLKMFDNAYDFALFNDRNPAMDLSHNPSHPINASDPHVFSNELAHFQHMEDLAKLRVDAMKKYTSEAVRKSVSTPFVVRDMVSLVDALGEKDGLLTYWGFSYGWVEGAILIFDKMCDGWEKAYDPAPALFSLSLSTILGAYFAAMMPDRVGRLVLDGVSRE